MSVPSPPPPLLSLCDRQGGSGLSLLQQAASLFGHLGQLERTGQNRDLKPQSSGALEVHRITPGRTRVPALSKVSGSALTVISLPLNPEAPPVLRGGVGIRRWGVPAFTWHRPSAHPPKICILAPLQIILFCIFSNLWAKQFL